MSSFSRGNFLFIVQGEGRGHMTQAIALQNMLHKAGFTVSEVLIGKSPKRSIPDFVKQQIKCPITQFDSPNFKTDAKMKSIKIFPSVVSNLMELGSFRKSLKLIRAKIKEHQPDIIINFYDPLAGLLYFFNPPSMPMICIAHQYIYHHPGFEFPKGRFMDMLTLKFYTMLTSIGSAKKLALSFYPINNNERNSIVAMPPLLRSEVFQQEIKNDGYLLAYLLNIGYMEEIIEWHKKNPETEIHCFTDRKEGEEVFHYSDKLHFHKLNDKKFLEMMSGAKALITTAGFESVCEAMYLGKPVFMVPVEGHYEQYCNARDAVKAGAGTYDSRFDIDKLFRYLPKHKNNNKVFTQWVDSAQERLLDELYPYLAPEFSSALINA
ncbi:MAG: glycosyltransferase family protein [Bacteroidia bacterium]